MDDNSVNLIELIALTRITAESTVERFGSSINSSFFDASNILATLKQKGLVDFVTAFPSQSTLKVTDAGNALIADANKKAGEPADALDMAIMQQLSNGRRGLVDLNGSVNVTQRDLALHLYKLNAQQQVSYELANANMNIYLTEKGFIAVKGTAMQQPMTPPMQNMQQQQAPIEQMQPSAPMAGITEPPKPGDDMKVVEELIKKSKQRKKNRIIMMIAGVVVVVVLVVLVFVLKLV